MAYVRFLAAVLTCAGAACSVHAESATPKVVGAVGAANAAPVGRAPGGSVRTLVPGDSIYFRDRILTKRGGSAQLTFLDRSTLSVGENSDLVIDEFVYKPGGAGTMSASLTKGVLRYVGGDISHGGGTTILTPTVTIGIRGGIGLIGAVTDAAALRDIPGVPRDFHGGTVVVNGYGALTLRNAQSEVILSKPGFAVFVGSAGEAIGAPVRVSAATAQAMMEKLTSRTGQHGGATAGSPVDHTSDAFALRSLAVPVATPVPAGINALDYTKIFSGGDALARNRSQARQTIQLQEALAAQAAALAAAQAKAAATASSSSQNGSQTSNSSGSSGSTGTGSAGSSSNLAGSLTTHDVNASTVTATTIYAHEIDAANIVGTIHVTNGYGYGNGNGGSDTSAATVQYGTISAHDIHATTVSATDIYVDLINGQ